MLETTKTEDQAQVAKGPKEVAIIKLSIEIERQFKDIQLSKPYQSNHRYYENEWAVDIKIPLKYQSLKDLNLFLDGKIKLERLSSFAITEGDSIVITVLTKTED